MDSQPKLRPYGNSSSCVMADSIASLSAAIAPVSLKLMSILSFSRRPATSPACSGLRVSGLANTPAAVAAAANDDATDDADAMAAAILIPAAASAAAAVVAAAANAVFWFWAAFCWFARPAGLPKPVASPLCRRVTGRAVTETATSAAIKRLNATMIVDVREKWVEMGGASSSKKAKENEEESEESTLRFT
ncbi:hypothetical protein B0H16DRAFT_1535860 [Mycena metata]|uniref:Uncharacterized protein n=1 Tax=Mycena metata TaxID=1033252 RepID=A0AAD7JAS8_9AGAR|nr:hypothetical protein B0H16DRAFT_1535860 [Mycena metata]